MSTFYRIALIMSTFYRIVLITRTFYSIVLIMRTFCCIVLILSTFYRIVLIMRTFIALYSLTMWGPHSVILQSNLRSTKDLTSVEILVMTMTTYLLTNEHDVQGSAKCQAKCQALIEIIVTTVIWIFAFTHFTFTCSKSQIWEFSKFINPTNCMNV